MKRKTIYRTLILSLFLGLAIWSCDDNEKKVWDVNSDPVLTLKAEEIHSVQGRTIRIEGTISDEVGIKKIQLGIDDWYLDRDIQISSSESLVKNYDLLYDFKVPEDAKDIPNIIQITVYNMGDRFTSQDLKVYMDGDFEAPEMNIQSPVNGLTVIPSDDMDLKIKAALNDTRQLGYFVAKESTLDYYDSISFEGTGKLAYEYQYSLTLPNDLAEYNFQFTVADSAGNVVTKNSIVKISFDFDKLYLSDVETEQDLVSDLFGVPMLIDKVAPFNFKARYYAETAGVEILFIPQKTSFAPNCFGLDPNNPAKLINDPINAEPIILGQKGYYLIDIDLENLTYNVESYVPDDWYFMPKMEGSDDTYIENEYVGELGLVGSGFPEYPDQNWNTSAPIYFERDPNNNYRFYKTLDMQGDVQFIFQPQHPWGWWPEPFWRFDSASEPEKTVLKGGDNVNMVVSVRTTYKVIFDSHIKRAKIIPVN